MTKKDTSINETIFPHGEGASLEKQMQNHLEKIYDYLCSTAPEGYADEAFRDVPQALFTHSGADRIAQSRASVGKNTGTVPEHVAAQESTHGRDEFSVAETLAQAELDAPDPRCKPDMVVNAGALRLALNVLRRAGKEEVADELEKTAVRFDDINAARWEQWCKGESLTVVVPTPTEKNPNSKTVIIYGSNPYPTFKTAMNNAIDAIINRGIKS